MKILILDNYDSFTYNIVQIITQQLGLEVDVFRNDEITLPEIAKYDKIILSPGPGLPCESGILPALIKEYAPSKSILGICLGHQAIGECFGAKLKNLTAVMHGIASPIYVVDDDYIFDSLSSPFQGGRYHSWVVDRTEFPSELMITACDDAGTIMGLKHRFFDVHGVQFHPESILSPEGATIIKNFLNA